jgi:hypothetical protein
MFRLVFTFDAEISLPETREMRLGKDYGGIIVSGQCDGVCGNLIIDHKTTERFDAEKYLDGWQWRFYLDIFTADKFVWNVWEMKEIDPKVYEVHGLHQLAQYRYPEIERDCRNLALEFKGFAETWIIPKMQGGVVPTDGSTKCAQTPEPKPEWKMMATRGHNLIAVGYSDGNMRCAFAGKEGAKFYVYDGVPEAEYQKILKNPFPDRLFTTNIKGKYQVKAA